MSTCSDSWLGLQGRVGVVTGAAGGIGLEIARQLLDAGVRVALMDRDVAALEAAITTLAVDKGRSMAVVCDVTDPASVEGAAQRIVDTWGPTQVLVNNAAALYADAIMDIQLEKWNQLMAVNLSGYLLCAQVFGRQMAALGSGAMVHIASISGSLPQPYSGAYSVSKAGVEMLSRLLAVELGVQGIRSNVVSPAMIRTPMSEVIYQNPEVLKRREAMVPLGRISTPIDIAEAVLFLASPRASYITGQEILVDGGLTQSWMGLIPRPGFEKSDAQAAAASSAISA